MPKTGNPQLENGHTRIANELLEAMARYPFGGGELKVLLAIIRLTYGWNRSRHPIRQTTLTHLTQLDRRQVQRVLTALRAQGVLFRDRTTRPFTYQLNKAYQGWRDWPSEAVPDKSVQFMEAANQGSTPGCELSHELDNIAAAAPDTCVRPCKERKIDIKDRMVDPAVENLFDRFSCLLNRPLTPKERELITRLNELSPDQAQQLLQQAAATCQSAPPQGGTSDVYQAPHPDG